MQHQAELNNITMEDVAKRLNLSVSTVSRAFSRSDLVNTATKQRIEQLCKQLNYRPNLNARAIATRKTNVIGMVSHDISKIEQFEPIAYQLEKIFYQNGYRLQIELGHSDADREKEIIETMLDRKVDGIIFGSRIYSGRLDAVETLIKSGTPFVVMGYYDNPRVSQVAGDFKLAAKTTVSHLIQLGHKKIAFMSYAQGDPRLTGYRQAYIEHGLEPCDDMLAYIDNKMFDIGKKIEQMLSAKATAIFAMHDIVAAQIYRICKQKGIRIPQDLSVAAISTGQQTDIWAPPLTVYQISNDNYAYSLSSILLDKINDELPFTRVVSLGGQLIARESAKMLC